MIAELYRHGNQEVIIIVKATLTSGLGLALLGVAAGSATIGAFLFAIVIWRHGRLPKWTAVLFVLAILLQALPSPTDMIELLGLGLFFISTSMIAWKGWRESGPGAG